MKMAVSLSGLALVGLLTACGGNSDNSMSMNEPSASPAESLAAEVAFAQLMIQHHEQAVDMADLALANATSLTAATITCTDDGTAVVELTAIEAGPGESTSDTTNVTISNVAPTATGLSAASPIDEGSSSALSLTAPTDASTVDAASLRYSFACDGVTLAADYT